MPRLRRSTRCFRLASAPGGTGSLPIPAGRTRAARQSFCIPRTESGPVTPFGKAEVRSFRSHKRSAAEQNPSPSRNRYYEIGYRRACAIQAPRISGIWLPPMFATTAAPNRKTAKLIPKAKERYFINSSVRIANLNDDLRLEFLCLKLRSLPCFRMRNKCPPYPS
jgi:hypothetical protein